MMPPPVPMVHFSTKIQGNILFIIPTNWCHGHINATGNQLIYDNDVRKVIERIIVKGSITVTGDCSCLFMDFIRLREFGFMGKMEFTDITNMRLMFNGCWMLSDLDDISRAQWDTSRVTDMSYLFSGRSKLEGLDGIATWDTGKVENMADMFSGCTGLTSLDSLAFTQWDTGNVRNMLWMFSECFHLTNLDGLEQAKWDTGNIKTMTGMFAECSELIDIHGLEQAQWCTSNLESVSAMFNGCRRLTRFPAIEWLDISAVSNDCFMEKCDGLPYTVSDSMVH